MLTIGSLFSGIGGIELGLERAGLGSVIWQSENDPYCLKVLAKHWPGVRRYTDVRQIDETAERPDIVCGGFPCQDISVAGRGEGIEGKRSGLWSEFNRCLRVVRPSIAIMENVSALLRRGMGRVQGDLAEGGLDTEWDCIPAATVGAPHLRDRLFIVAHPTGGGCGWRWRGKTTSPMESSRLVESRDWALEATSRVCRDGNGIPKRLDRLRGLGNAVVPQVAEYIGQMIKHSFNPD